MKVNNNLVLRLIYRDTSLHFKLPLACSLCDASRVIYRLSVDQDCLDTLYGMIDFSHVRSIAILLVLIILLLGFLGSCEDFTKAEILYIRLTLKYVFISFGKRFFKSLFDDSDLDRLNSDGNI